MFSLSPLLCHLQGWVMQTPTTTERVRLGASSTASAGTNNIAYADIFEVRTQKLFLYLFVEGRC